MLVHEASLREDVCRDASIDDDILLRAVLRWIEPVDDLEADALVDLIRDRLQAP